MSKTLISRIAGVWVLLSVATTAILAAVAARGHARRDDRVRGKADPT